ncbi:MAG: signal peptidase I [Nitrososphaerales archaeon]
MRLIYLVPIIAIIFSYFAVIAVTGEQHPYSIVLGPSMQPTILPGAVVVLEHVPFGQLRIGDVIVFIPQVALHGCQESATGSSLITESAIPCYVSHRIVSIQNKSGRIIITTKGDNNLISIRNIDTNISKQVYVGKIVMQFPLAGYLTVAPYSEYLAALIPLALAIEFLVDRKKSSDTFSKLRDSRENMKFTNFA